MVHLKFRLSFIAIPVICIFMLFWLIFRSTNQDPFQTNQLPVLEMGQLNNFDLQIENASMDSANIVPMPPPYWHSIWTDTDLNNYDNNLLVVGGTDGSGSRRAVSLLANLGVKMVSEDFDTFDVHANEIGGWPKLVRPIIEVLVCIFIIWSGSIFDVDI